MRRLAWTGLIGCLAVLPAVAASCTVDTFGTAGDPVVDSGQDASGDVLIEAGAYEAGSDGDKLDADVVQLETGVDAPDELDAPQEPACDPDKAPWEDLCAVTDAQGVFVSSSKGNDTTGDGTSHKPYQTLAKALSEAEKTDKKRVFACAETYAEAVAAKTGIWMFGGFDCGKLGAWTTSTKHATVQAPAGTQAALIVVSGTTDVRIGEIDFVSADAIEPGGSSLGAYVENSTITLERLTIHAGKGEAGAAPAPKPAGAQNGTVGIPGLNAMCGVDAGATSSGAAPVMTSCGGGTSQSGAGGQAVSNANGNPGLPGDPVAANPVPPKDGLGGAGGKIGFSCADGHDGAPGDMGASGSGGVGTGMFSNGSYVPVNGHPGDPGKVGQGGGGGGASAGAVGCAGSTGGSGGSGGCGGLGGMGGKGGGASIALVVMQGGAGVILKDISLISSDGGKGGAGQPGGEGGLAADGGPGGTSSGTILHACKGGWGAPGGKGGGGGGGTGGPSISLWYTGDNPALNSGSAAIVTGQGSGGAGGPGGDAKATAGANGAEAGVHPG